MGIVLRFNDGQRDISLVIKNVIRAFLLTTTVELAVDKNFAFSEREFFSNLRVSTPSCSIDDSRSDVLGADIALSKILFVENIKQGVSKSADNAKPVSLALVAWRRQATKVALWERTESQGDIDCELAFCRKSLEFSKRERVTTQRSKRIMRFKVVAETFNS